MIVGASCITIHLGVSSLVEIVTEEAPLPILPRRASALIVVVNDRNLGGIRNPALRRLTVNLVHFHECFNGDIDKRTCRFAHRLVGIGLLGLSFHSFPAASYDLR